MLGKISPFFWFDKQAEEAISFYTAIFPQSRIVQIKRYPSDYQVGPQSDMAGRILTAEFELAGQRFFALDGGPYFQFTPAISLMVNCDSVDEIDQLWEQLAAGGSVLMPLQAYPFNERFGWLTDRYGLTWQLQLGSQQQKIVPFLTFTGPQHGKAERAIAFYTALLPDSGIDRIERYGEGEDGPAGTVRFVQFRLNGQTFMAIDNALAHDFTFSEAISLFVDCSTQAEIDHLWDALSAVPEAEQCGWLKDRFGVSWQIIPDNMGEWMSDSDPERAQRVAMAMMEMKKIDIAALERARLGQSV
jgi:predicted 3-demethylubiquinone-9 3-methyltransferase (glyoxalase superfamily)